MALSDLIEDSKKVELYNVGISNWTNAQSYARQALDSLNEFKLTDCYTDYASTEEKSDIDSKINLLTSFVV